VKSAIVYSKSAVAARLGPGLLWLVFACVASRAQTPPSNSISLPTALRVTAPGWWPTKGTASRDEFVGSDRCYDCHELKSESQERTAMYQAASPAANSNLLREHNHLEFELEPYHYQIETRANKSVMTISNASASLSVDLLWAFGSGHMGQTYIYQKDGKFYESHLSYYTGPRVLDITPGQSRLLPSNLEAAAGRAMPVNESHKCFGCHTTASMTNNQFAPKDSFPGVTCEACHGPGAKHVAAATAHIEKAGSGLILNPARFERVDYVDFCGACHRTWQDVVSGHLTGAGELNVRFAPYRLENSRCWKKGDARLTCVFCHDPHKPLEHDLASYDSNCLLCHVATAEEKKTPNRPGAPCPVATKNCVSCHMPKVEPPNLHSAFTDHWIRIPNPGAAYPD
jgi:hypothetical protein